MNLYRSRRLIYPFLAISLILNLIVIGTILYFLVMTPSAKQYVDKDAVQPGSIYPMEANLPISVLNQLIQQALAGGPPAGTKAAHLAGLTFGYSGSQILIHTQVFLFGKTLNLNVFSRFIVLNGDIRLDVTGADISGFALPRATLFSVLHAVELPDWIRIDQPQQQIWLHVTGHKFGNFGIYVKAIDPVHDRILVGLRVAN